MHRDALMGLARVLAFARRLTRDLHPRANRFPAAEGDWAAYHFPLAELVGVRSPTRSCIGRIEKGAGPGSSFGSGSRDFSARRFLIASPA
jgi:hypothetical protein